MAGKPLKVIRYFPHPEGTHIEDGKRYKERSELTEEELAFWKKNLGERLGAALVRAIQKDPECMARLEASGVIQVI